MFAMCRYASLVKPSGGAVGGGSNRGLRSSLDSSPHDHIARSRAPTRRVPSGSSVRRQAAKAPVQFTDYQRCVGFCLRRPVKNLEPRRRLPICKDDPEDQPPVRRGPNPTGTKLESFERSSVAIAWSARGIERLRPLRQRQSRSGIRESRKTRHTTGDRCAEHHADRVALTRSKDSDEARAVQRRRRPARSTSPRNLTCGSSHRRATPPHRQRRLDPVGAPNAALGRFCEPERACYWAGWVSGRRRR